MGNNLMENMIHGLAKPANYLDFGFELEYFKAKGSRLRRDRYFKVSASLS